MKRLLAILLLCALPLAAGVIIKNPYTAGGTWYVGQLHTHTKYDAATNATGSDGANTPAQIETAYHNSGYDFLVSTDHRSGTYTGGGVTADPGGTDLLWILGEEIDTTQGHLPLLGIDAAVNAPYSKGAAQTDIDAARAANGIAMVAHPVTYAPWAWWAEVEPIKRLSLIEVINGPNIGIGSDWPLGVDLADEYRQVWWTGVDDAHNTTTHHNLYCVVVQTASGTIAEADILSSLDSGDFYIRQTATGPAISSVGVSGSTITLTMPSGSYSVTWYKKGKRALRTDSGVTTTASYTAAGTEGWISAMVSDGSKSAWTQPLFVINDIDLSSAAAASEGTAANLIDNNAATTCDWTAATGNFTIDLGAAKQANGMRIAWNISGPERWNYKIEESTTGAFAGEETEQVRTTFSNRASTTTDVFDCWTRYLKVTITGASVGSSNVSVKEVEIFDASPEISEYYIDNVGGNDTWTGFSSTTALKTLGVAFPLLRPRDRLNFVSSGTTYGQLRPDNYSGLNAAFFGKHFGAWCYFRGIGMPDISVNNSTASIYVASNYEKFMDFSGFSCSGSKYAVNSTSNVSNINFSRIKISSPAWAGFRIAGTVSNINFTYCVVSGSTVLGFYDYTEAGSMINFYNCVAYGNGTVGFDLGTKAASVVTVKNCISSTNSSTEFARGSSTLTDSNNSTDGTYSGTWAKTDNADVAAQFVNAAAGDFRLKATSPLLRKGVSVGLTLDVAGNTVPAYTGKAPDIGAYEMNYSSDRNNLGAWRIQPRHRRGGWLGRR